MKKNVIMTAVWVLIISLMLTFAAGCNEPSAPNGTEASSGDESESTPAEAYPSGLVDGVLDERLTDAIAEYLTHLRFGIDVRENHFYTKLDRIKNGGRWICAAFDPDDYYYVCAYYTADHEGTEGHRYCCASDYTWIGFESEKDIKESYNGDALVAAFQINRSHFHDDKGGAAEHFKIYEPVFENGVNIARSMMFNGAFVYITRSEEDILFITSDALDHEVNSVEGAVIDGRFYAVQYLSKERDGVTYEAADLRREFGEYYERLTEIMLSFEIARDDGVVYHYGLFEVWEMGNVLTEK